MVPDCDDRHLGIRCYGFFRSNRNGFVLTIFLDVLRLGEREKQPDGDEKSHVGTSTPCPSVIRSPWDESLHGITNQELLGTIHRHYSDLDHSCFARSGVQQAFSRDFPQNDQAPSCADCDESDRDIQGKSPVADDLDSSPAGLAAQFPWHTPVNSLHFIESKAHRKVLFLLTQNLEGVKP